MTQSEKDYHHQIYSEIMYYAWELATDPQAEEIRDYLKSLVLEKKTKQLTYEN